MFDLSSNDKTLSYKAFDQIAALYNMTQRQDCLIVIIGFIIQNIRNSRQVQNFLHYLRFINNFAVSEHLLRIISKDKEIVQQRIFMNRFLEYIRSNKGDYDEEQISQILGIIEEADWGIKTKNKFLMLFKRHDIF